MRNLSSSLLRRVLISGSLLSATFAGAQQVATIRSVSVVKQGGGFALEIDSSSPVSPKTQVVTGPDRLVIDFPNAVPGASLRPLLVNTSQVRGVRMGLFESTPPVARVVVDLNGPQPYEIFPTGNKVVVKLAAGKIPAAPRPVAQIHGAVPNAAPAVAVASQPSQAQQPPQPARPHAEVDFRDGKLSISSDRARLADILHEVQRRTGANVMLPPGGGQEAVIAHLGPASVREVLSALLDGSAYNIVMVGAPGDRSSVASVILTAKNGGEDSPANFAARADQPTPESQGDAAPPAPDPPPPAMDNPPDNPPPGDNAQPGAESGPAPDSIPVPPPPQ